MSNQINVIDALFGVLNILFNLMILGGMMYIIFGILIKFVVKKK